MIDMGSKKLDFGGWKIRIGAFLTAILLTFSWFIGVPENKVENLASNRADFTLNSNPKINLDFHGGKPLEVFVEPKLLSHTSSGYIDVASKSISGVKGLLELTKGFGGLINVPQDQLSGAFSLLDKQILDKISEVYGGVALGEQCGLPGMAFTYPPGSDDFKTACGGTPAYSGIPKIPTTALAPISGIIEDQLGKLTNLSSEDIKTVSSILSGNIGGTLGSLISQGLPKNQIISQLNDLIGSQLGSTLGDLGLGQSIIGGITSQITGALGDAISGLVGDTLGGVLGFGGRSCNTDKKCYFSGKCFYVPLIGCTVKSCYGKCGGSSSLSLSSLGSGLISGLGSSLLGGVSSGLLGGLGGDLLSGLGSSAISSLGSGILSGLGSNLTSGLASGLLNGLGSNVLNGLTGSLGNALGSSVLQQLGGSAIQSIASQLGVNLSQGTISQISGIVQQVAGGNLSNLSSSQLLSLGKQIGGAILKNVGSGAISNIAKQAGSSLAGQLGQQALSSTIGNVVGSGGGGGGGAAYLWDSITHTCGCGTGGGNGTAPPVEPPLDEPPPEPPVTLDNGLTVDSDGIATNSVAGVEFSGEYNPDGTTVVFDNSMTEAEKDAWIANNPVSLANAPPGTIIYVSPENNFATISAFQNNGNATVDAFNCVSCVNDNGANITGNFINASLTGPASEGGYPLSFNDISYSDQVLLHEIGHQELDLAGLSDDAFIQNQFSQYNNSLPFGGEKFTDYGSVIQYPSANEYAAEVYALYKGSNGTYQPSVPASAQIYNDTANYMKSKGVLP